MMTFSAAQQAALPRTTPDLIASKLGRPDRVVSTEGDSPRPPLVTRLLYYDGAGVYIALAADAPVGAPPPYRSWLLMGAADIQTKEVVGLAAAVERIKVTRGKALLSR